MTSSFPSRLNPRDVLLHTPPFGEPTWLETNWFSFIVPERAMYGHVTSKFRSNLGVVMSTIEIWSKDCKNHLEFDYFDQRVHLPMPRRNFDKYELDNGLSVNMVEPGKRFHVTYDGFKGDGFDLDYVAMMPPVDSHDILVDDGGEDMQQFYAIKDLYKPLTGHIDQTFMVTGTLRLGSETIEVNFPGQHDHSWGPRPEFGHGLGNIDEGYFGQDLAFHVQTRNTTGTEGKVVNGYIIDHGELRRVTRGVGRYEVDGWFTTKLVYELTDDSGKDWTFTGDVKSNAPLPPFPNQYIICGVTEWSCADMPTTGWGKYCWHWEVSDMIGKNGWE